MLGWCWPSVVDAEPPSAQHWLNASCPMGEATRTKADTWHNPEAEDITNLPRCSTYKLRQSPLNSKPKYLANWLTAIPTTSLENSATYHKKKRQKKRLKDGGRSHTWQIKGVKSETCGRLLANAGSTLGQSNIHWPDLKQPFFLVHVRGWPPDKTNKMSAEVDCRLGKM